MSERKGIHRKVFRGKARQVRNTLCAQHVHKRYDSFPATRLGPSDHATQEDIANFRSARREGSSSTTTSE